MTREEAIANLKMIRVAFVDPGTKEQRKLVDDTFDMAIQALENHDTFMKYAYSQGKHDALSQEPTVTSTDEPMTMVYPTIVCDDAISRQAVKELIKSGVSTDTYDDVEQVCKWIDALPSVTQKSGKWIKVKSGDKDFPESIVCSRCNNENSHLDFNENAEPIGKVFVTSKYCPNCGCRMFEPQESEE